MCACKSGAAAAHPSAAAAHVHRPRCANEHSSTAAHRPWRRRCKASRMPSSFWWARRCGRAWRCRIWLRQQQQRASASSCRPGRRWAWWQPRRRCGCSERHGTTLAAGCCTSGPAAPPPAAPSRVQGAALVISCLLMYSSPLSSLPSPFYMSVPGPSSRYLLCACCECHPAFQQAPVHPSCARCPQSCNCAANCAANCVLAGGGLQQAASRWWGQ